VFVDAALYRDGKRLPGPFVLDGARAACADPQTFCWIGLYEPTEEEFDAVRKEFDLHELAVEDAVHAHQRPKLDLYDEMLLLVLKPARYVDPVEVIELGEILLFVDPDFMVAVRHREASRLVEVRRSLERQPEELRLGPSAVLLAVLDRVVDDYAEVLDGLDGDIRELEDQVFSDTDSTPTERIYKLKREVLQFHQATSPLLEPLSRLARGNLVAINRELHDYFGDVHDHLVRVVDKITAFRDLLTSILEANLTQVSVRQNNDMRKISAWVAIAAVPTMLAGIWGMNFRYMPEIDELWGYPAVLTLMVLACAILYRKFKRSGWL
jgi:magnesium transporter